MKPARLSRGAVREIEAAAATYEAARRGLAAEFRHELDACLDRIRRHPGTWPTFEDSPARMCSVDRFPYAIYYVDLPDRIWIAAVAHHSRRPGYWTRRTPD